MKIKLLLPVLLLTGLALAGCSSTPTVNTVPVAPGTATPTPTAAPQNTTTVSGGSILATLTQTGIGQTSQTFTVPKNGFTATVRCQGSSTAQLQVSFDIAGRANADSNNAAPDQVHSAKFACGQAVPASVLAGGTSNNADLPVVVLFDVLSGKTTKATLTVAAN